MDIFKVKGGIMKITEIILVVMSMIACFFSALLWYSEYEELRWKYHRVLSARICLILMGLSVLGFVGGWIVLFR